jgi:hypothetical protein
MNHPFTTFPQTYVLPVNAFPAGLFGGGGASIRLESGITTLVGPNGTGKTKIMSALRDILRSRFGNQYVRFLSAGRMGIMEGYRSNTEGTGNPDTNETHVGRYNTRNQRKNSETVIGDFLALDERPDLRLKVEARLQGLFHRTLSLSWTQSGLKVDFRSLEPGATSYGAGSEASGLTQLVAMLAAIYDDEIKFLLIDEPEVSLHPQLQSFILNEIQQVAGNPDTVNKKCVVISTHSPSMLGMKKVGDLPSILFFGDTSSQPIQINAASPVLADPNLESVVLRVSESYKIAMFAHNILLSEGLSDEIVINTLADLKRANFQSTGVQVLPVNGKGDLKAADLFFNTIGKRTYILADLDVTDNRTMSEFLDAQKNVGPALTPGFPTLADQFDDFKADLQNLIATNFADISGAITTQGYWISMSLGSALRNERSVISYLASNSSATLAAMPNSGLWTNLQSKLTAILDIMDNHGLVLIRKGSIEDCYLNPGIPAGTKKPQAASLEAVYLLHHNPPQLDQSYVDIIKAINKIKRSPQVDEAALLRQKLGSIIGAIDASFTDVLDDAAIGRIIAGINPELSTLFEIKRRTAPGNAALEITVVSKLFASYGTIITHERGESTNTLLGKLPST